MLPQAPRPPLNQYDAYALHNSLLALERYAETAHSHTFVASHADYPLGIHFVTQSASVVSGQHRYRREAAVTLIWAADLRGVRREIVLLVAAWLGRLVNGFARRRRAAEIEEGKVGFAWESVSEDALGILEFRIRESLLWNSNSRLTG